MDPLYGRFELPQWLAELAESPEVRRLSQIRLLNTLSPSLATLGELRRYSHTLGVTHLALQAPLGRFADAERRALLACILIHDVGTPPFAHLFEYHLAERAGWHHETVLEDIFRAKHAPENRAHQIFAGRTTGLESSLLRSRVDLDLVEAILTAKHPLARLIFGSLDFDNLDNVVRMAWALGLTVDSTVAEALACKLSVSRESNLLLARDESALVEAWLALRRAVYDILVFDPPTVAAQAVLSEAIGLALRNEVLVTDDWSLTDELLLERLRGDRVTKGLISLEYLGRLPSHLFTVQLVLRESAEWSRVSIKKRADEALLKCPGLDRPLSYVFIDNGAFSKKLTFMDTNENLPWSVGERSRSAVVYGFCRGPKTGMKRRQGALESVLQALTAVVEDVSRVDLGSGSDHGNVQQTLEFSTSRH